VTPSTRKLFSKVTHLDFGLHLSQLSFFPSITHLILDEDLEEFKLYHEVLGVYPNLKVIIVNTLGYDVDPCPTLACDLTTLYGLDLEVVHLSYDDMKSWRSNGVIPKMRGRSERRL